MLLKFGILLFGLSLLVGKIARQLLVRREVRAREMGFSKKMTGAEFARKLLEAKGIDNVKVVESTAIITNFYDPALREVRLSPENYKGMDLASIAYAAHEVGHAIQHAQGHHPLHWRVTAIRSTVYTSMAVLAISLPLLFFPRFAVLVLGGGWALIRLHNIMTVPVEIDASGRVKDLIINARILPRSVEMDRLEEMLSVVALEKVPGFGTLWGWAAQRILPWRKKSQSTVSG